MIEVSSFIVASFDFSYLDLTWAIRETGEDLLDYGFTVLRSEATAGPYELISPEMFDRYRYRDTTVNLRNTSREYHYKLRVRHVPTGTTFETAFATREGDPTPVTARIIELEERYLQEKVGTRLFLFPVRTFGQRCPTCYNQFTGRRRDDACPTCWGTGLSGGFHYPVGFWGQIDPKEHSSQVTTTTHLQTQFTRMRMGPNPAVKPADLVIDRVNTRYRVSSVSPSKHLGVCVHQEVNLVRCALGGIEYKVPLNIDPHDVDLVPPREFLNATAPDMGSVEGCSIFAGLLG